MKPMTSAAVRINDVEQAPLWTRISAKLRWMNPEVDPSQPFARLFDFRINLTSLLALGTLIFAGATTMSKMETRSDHEADMQRIEATFVRQDVNMANVQQLKEWKESIQLLMREHIEALDRIERQLAEIEYKRSHRAD